MIDRAIFERVVKLVRAGATGEVACLAAGIPAADLPAYLGDPACSAEIAAAEASVEAALLARVLSDESGSGARWYLERRFPARWGPAALKAVSAARVDAAAAAASTAEPDTALERAAMRRSKLRLVPAAGHDL